jgi:predicted ester cyclase
MEKGGEIMKKLVVFVCLMVLFCFALGAQMKMEPGACEKKAQVLLDKVLEMWNKPNLALIPELYTTDCVATTSSMPAPFVGHEGIRKWIENTRVMIPDLVMAFPEVVAKPDMIATIWTMTGTQTGPMVMPGGTLPPTGRKVSVTGMSIDYLKDGKFVKETVIFNVLEMMMQMGFTLAPPQMPEAK